jgi:hypothetical protein
MTSTIEPRLRQYSSAFSIYVKCSTGGLTYPKVRQATVTCTYAYLGPIMGKYNMGARTVRPRMALSISIYILKYGGPPADDEHPGGRRTDGHPGGWRAGGRYTTDGHTVHTFLRYGGRENTKGPPTQRQGRYISTWLAENGTVP